MNDYAYTKTKYLTETPKKLLRYLISYQKEHGWMPCTKEIMKEIVFASPRSVTQYLDVLEDAGFISRNYGRRVARGIKIIREK